MEDGLIDVLNSHANSSTASLCSVCMSIQAMASDTLENAGSEKEPNNEFEISVKKHILNKCDDSVRRGTRAFRVASEENGRTIQ